jgi:hypothetical protein
LEQGSLLHSQVRTAARLYSDQQQQYPLLARQQQEHLLQYAQHEQLGREAFGVLFTVQYSWQNDS